MYMYSCRNCTIFIYVVIPMKLTYTCIYGGCVDGIYQIFPKIYELLGGKMHGNSGTFYGCKK